MSIQAVAEAVLDEAPPGDLFQEYMLEPLMALRPSQDYIDGTLYYTFPLLKPATKKVGKGKDAQIISTTVVETVAITSQREYFAYTEEELTKRGFRWPASFTETDKLRWNTYAIQDWLKGNDTPIDGLQLFETLQKIYRDHVQYEQDMHYTLVPLYVMGSYLFQLFDAIGYIHFNGTMSTGKSQNLRLMAAFGFNATWSSNMSEASLFRATAGSPGVLCVDEAESFKTERGQQLRLLLNAGYLKGNQVTRAEKSGESSFQIVKFDTYSPKILASIAPIEPVLASRCLIINMQPATRLIPEFNESEDRWAAVRSDLYFWALQNANKVKATIDLWQDEHRNTLATALTNRTWQISQLYVTLADHILGRSTALQIIEWLAGYFETKRESTNETDRQRKLLRILPRVLLTKEQPKPGLVLLKDIVEVLKEFSEEDEYDYIKSKGVSRHLTALGWEGRKPHKLGTCVVITEDEVREQMKRRDIEPLEDDVRWFNGEAVYTNAQTTTESDSQSDIFSWMDEQSDDQDT